MPTPSRTQAPLLRLLRLIYSRTVHLGWDAIAAVAGVHFLVSWQAMALAGEAKIAAPEIFFYFYAVTVSTVGYGDFSPTTTTGRIVFVTFLLPGGLAIFTTVLGKAVGSTVAAFTSSWRNSMKGLMDHSGLVGHTVVFGWNPATSPRLIGQLEKDLPDGSTPSIVLVSDVVAENPLPGRVEFVRAVSMSSQDALARSGVATACVVVVSCADDAKTLEIGLSVGSLPKRPRIVAAFMDEEKALLFERSVMNAETAVTLTAETMARTARDPGTADLQRRLMSIHDDHTQFSVIVAQGPGVLYGDVFVGLRKRFGAVALGTMRVFGEVDVNPGDEATVLPGDTIFYVAGERIDQDSFDEMVADFRTTAPVDG